MKGSKGQKGQLIFLYKPCDSLVIRPSSCHALFHRIAVRREIPIQRVQRASVIENSKFRKYKIVGNISEISSLNLQFVNVI